MINGLVARFRSGIDQHAHFRFQHPSDRIEQPPMTVDLLFVFLFEHKDNLYWDEIVRITRVGLDQLGLCIDGYLGRILRKACMVLVSYIAFFS